MSLDRVHAKIERVGQRWAREADAVEILEDVLRWAEVNDFPALSEEHDIVDGISEDLHAGLVNDLGGVVGQSLRKMGRRRKKERFCRSCHSTSDLVLAGDETDALADLAAR